MKPGVQPYNEKASTVWGSSGRAYDEMSRSMVAAIEHLVARLAPRPGERALDVATGTGWTSRCLAERGAQTTGIDFAEASLEAAREIATAAALDIDYHRADAEALPYPDGHFDVVTSTFGVMFAVDQSATAAELARVVRPGGRLALTSWLPEPIGASEGRQAANGETSKVLAPYVTPPSPPPPSPFNWGRRDWIQKMLGGAFDFGFETGTIHQYFSDGEAGWQFYLRTFGPFRAIAQSLDDDRRKALSADMASLYDHFRDGLGVSVPFDYLLAVGTRR